MELNQVQELAKTYLLKYAPDWTFKFDTATVRMGLCKHSTKTISISKKIAELNSLERLKRTIIHELAHAIVGIGHGHDYVWKNKCIELGGDGRRCYSMEDTVTPKAKYKLVCPNCGETVGKNKLTARTKRIACAACCNKYNNGKYDVQYKFQIIENK